MYAHHLFDKVMILHNKIFGEPLENEHIHWEILSNIYPEDHKLPTFGVIPMQVDTYKDKEKVTEDQKKNRSPGNAFVLLF